MPAAEPQNAARAAARAYEQSLPPAQRKQLGQYFSGLPLGKLLAHLALTPGTERALDPMAGHGDLLDATWEAAAERGIALKHLDGIEIDPATAVACRERMSAIALPSPQPVQHIIAGSAFDPGCASALSHRHYDLVITNPPYVRYQSRNGGSSEDSEVRSGLGEITASLLSGADAKVWRTLTEGYSGLADLSVPAWLLAAALVRPGGRLALVVPATWRSRDYADVIRYLLLRCFSLECIVEDQQPGWFSDALVRTHLVIARRLETHDAAAVLGTRTSFPNPVWIQVAPEAAAGGSLVGSVFAGPHPEAAFAAWVHSGCKGKKAGLQVRPFDMRGEWAALEKRVAGRRWYGVLETATSRLPLFQTAGSRNAPAVPDAFADLLNGTIRTDRLVALEDSGVTVGQGLRTGCNDFFYVTACGDSGGEALTVEASPLFGSMRFTAPAAALRPALRRQAELSLLEAGRVPDSRVLDLRSWVLPEDRQTILAAEERYRTAGERPPHVMPNELAAFVRSAAKTRVNGSTGKPIPTLSAVCTNVRPLRNGRATPRFWYMLPDFAPRHLPLAFAPRINNGLPRVEANFDPPILIDANFATFWSTTGAWTALALKALLNSVWCRAMMEALGTPMGGGALKLEATHLRHMPVPSLSSSEIAALDTIGLRLAGGDAEARQQADRAVLRALLHNKNASVPRLAGKIEARARSLTAARQRAA